MAENMVVQATEQVMRATSLVVSDGRAATGPVANGPVTTAADGV